MSGAAVITAIGTAAAAAGQAGQAVASGKMNKRGQKEAARQFDLSFNQRQKEFAAQMEMAKKVMAWEQMWGDVLNAQQRTQNSQAIQGASGALKTDRLTQNLQREQLNKRLGAMKNYSIATKSAQKNFNDYKQQFGINRQPTGV
jgi:hypothetical protein